MKEAREILEGQGFDVVVRDGREDSPRWKPHPKWRGKVRRGSHKVLAAIGQHKALRIVAGKLDLIADTIAAVARAYPEIRIAVAVTSRRQLKKILARLRTRILSEPMGLYTAQQKRPQRVSVGLIRQFPGGAKGDFDLLVLPFAAETVGDEALRAIFAGRYRRLLSFTPFRTTTDGHITRRLELLADTVYPPPKPRVPIGVVVLESRGTQPDARFENPMDAKGKLYWNNSRRNRRIAHVARQLMWGTVRAIRTLGIDNPKTAAKVAKAAQHGVAILVETLPHARQLSTLLPGWAVWTAQDPLAPNSKPRPGCGVIVTELAADETVISAGVFVRATGTKHPLPDIDWPWVGEVDRGVLVDFRDAYHASAMSNAQARIKCYRLAGMEIWSLPAKSHAEDASDGATGRKTSGRTPTPKHQGTTAA